MKNKLLKGLFAAFLVVLLLVGNFVIINHYTTSNKFEAVIPEYKEENTEVEPESTPPEPTLEEGETMVEYAGTCPRCGHLYIFREGLNCPKCGYDGNVSTKHFSENDQYYKDTNVEDAD